MSRNIVETILGGVVLLVAVVFLFYAYENSSLKPVRGYEIEARFNSVDGLSTGNDVRIGGVKIGSIVGLSVDPQNYQVRVRMTVGTNIRLPEDSAASITGDGLLGGKYVKVDPGDSENLIAPGGLIGKTKDVVALEQLLGRAIFLLTEN
jgi:phospholipid/cholesterol/gamma-HCH transport system substrate-binding protein